MRAVYWYVLIVVIIVGGISGSVFTRFGSSKQSMTDVTIRSAHALSLKSPAFGDNSMIPAKHTCDGGLMSGMSPQLEISGVDPLAKSLVLIMEDPDASPATWNHWVRFNIPPGTKVIEEGKEPSGKAGIGTNGNSVYYGPCPPSGTHRYIFRLFSLDSELDLAEGASKDQVEGAMTGHILQETTLTGLYTSRGIQ